MEFMKFDADKCSLCGICVEKCPFGALTIEGAGIVVSESCRFIYGQTDEKPSHVPA